RRDPPARRVRRRRGRRPRRVRGHGRRAGDVRRQRVRHPRVQPGPGDHGERGPAVGGGLTVDDVNGSDRDAVTAANEALMRTAGGTLSVIGFDSKLPEFLPLWAKAAGADLLSEDGRTAQLDAPEVVEALEWA